MVWMFDDQIKSDRNNNKTIITHFSHFHKLDLMEFNPIEGNIYSFHSVGPDISMDLEIEPIHDSFFDNI